MRVYENIKSYKKRLLTYVKEHKTLTIGTLGLAGIIGAIYAYKKYGDTK
jgi:hypothetical protein